MSSEKGMAIYQEGFINIPKILAEINNLVAPNKKLTDIEEFDFEFSKTDRIRIWLNPGGYDHNRDETTKITLDNATFKQIKSGLKTPDGQEIYLFFAKGKEWSPKQPNPEGENWYYLEANTIQKFQEKKRKEYQEKNIKLEVSEGFYDKLAEQALKEKWDYGKETKSPSKHKYPLLVNYIEYTLKRLDQEKKLLFSKDKTKMIFNTGLFSLYLEPIIVLADVKGPTFYTDARIFNATRSDFATLQILKPNQSGEKDSGESTEYVMSSEEVPFASFFSNTNELVFDPFKKIDLTGFRFREHISDDAHLSRLSTELNKEDWQMLFPEAVRRSTQLAKRNYKLVVPQWSFEKSGIQFLMPLYRGGENQPFVALVLDPLHDHAGEYYRPRTIFSLTTCYQNARLIARPDNFWLDPENILGDEEKK